MKFLKPLSVFAVGLIVGAMLVLHSSTVKAQSSGMIRVFRVDSSFNSITGRPLPGRVVGFSCIPDESEKESCYIVTQGN
jgi:hypothetical protein